MLDFSTVQVVEQTVAEKTQAGELFTAHDVTKAVRAKVGRGVNVSHNDVKQEVHNLFANGQMGSDYSRNLANLPGVPVQPWVYHRTTDDPASYGTGTVTPAVPAPVNVVVAVTNQPDDGVNQTKDGTYKVDARETLCLPATLLRDAGLNAGDTANVLVDALAGQVAVAAVGATLPAVYTPLATYTVDKYGNVRVTQATLQRAGIGGKEYVIEGDATMVTVKKA